MCTQFLWKSTSLMQPYATQFVGKPVFLSIQLFSFRLTTTQRYPQLFMWVHKMQLLNYRSVCMPGWILERENSPFKSDKGMCHKVKLCWGWEEKYRVLTHEDTNRNCMCMKQELHAMAGARDWFYPIFGIALKVNVNMQSLNKTSKNSQVWKNA